MRVDAKLPVSETEELTHSDGLPTIAIVIPAFNVEGWITNLLHSIPAWISLIVVVDDGSTDSTAHQVELLAVEDDRIQFERHERQRGLTEAMVTGIRASLNKDVDIVVKMDGDGQMDSRHLPEIVRPLVLGQCDYTKGNRFRYAGSLRGMPVRRRIGNLALSFFIKAAVGYWDIFDPTNGFVAIRASVLKQVNLESIRGYYFFETSLLAELYLLRAVVKDVPMPALYRGEPSHMNIGRVMLEFPFRLSFLLIRRVWINYFLLDFSIVSVYLCAGMFLLTIGAGYGSVSWWYYASEGHSAPTGTVVIPAMLIILATQFFLAAITIDVEAVPRQPSDGTKVPNIARLLELWQNRVR